MLHRSEMSLLKGENELALLQVEIRMIRWMCGVKIRDKLSCVELWQQLGIEDIAKVVQRTSLQWYGRVLRKDDNGWVKMCCFGH